jgi:hypothetical protein
VVNESWGIVKQDKALVLFIFSIRIHWSIVHFLFHEGEAADFSSDQGNAFQGCSESLTDVSG